MRLGRRERPEQQPVEMSVASWAKLLSIRGLMIGVLVPVLVGTRGWWVLLVVAVCGVYFLMSALFAAVAFVAVRDRRRSDVPWTRAEKAAVVTGTVALGSVICAVPFFVIGTFQGPAVPALAWSLIAVWVLAQIVLSGLERAEKRRVETSASSLG